MPDLNLAPQFPEVWRAGGPWFDYTFAVMNLAAAIAISLLLAFRYSRLSTTGRWGFFGLAFTCIIKFGAIFIGRLDVSLLGFTTAFFYTVVTVSMASDDWAKRTQQNSSTAKSGVVA